ncbi:MAG: hypothetical protein ABMA13_17470, partial [Chthoniobacteraceae bacterium]
MSVAELRELLARKFPASESKPAGVLPTGLQCIEELRRGAVTELTGPSSASALFIEAMLAVLRRERSFGALVDAANTFDPQGTESARLLWVRCANAMQAVKAADLLVRDGNLPLVLLDLQASPARELRRIPASTWHRFQRLVEPTGTVFVVLSAQPMVEGAKVRIAVRQRWTLAAMRERRSDLLARLDAQVFARREFSALPPLER